jgi:peptidoglycan/LPS O-acetylase OafA/YrhL
VRSLVTVVFLGMIINSLCLIGTLEWEIPGSLNLLVMHRPAWLYPVVFGGISFFIIMLARRIVPRWGATGTALAAYGIRGALTGIMAAAHYPTPRFLPVMLLGAILLDVVPWERVQNAVVRMTGMALLFTGGYLAVALPLLNGRPGLRPFAPGDTLTAVAVTFVVCLVLLPVANMLGDRLAGAPPAPAPVTPGYQTM